MRLSRKRLIVAGLFSARLEDPTGALDELARRLTDAGAEVVGRVLQRRGVSRDTRPGGAKRMDRPLSSRTVLGAGKAKELAALCAETGADSVVFHNELSDRQREELTKLCGVPVHDASSAGV